MPWTTAVTRATGFGVTASVWNTEHVDNMNYLKEVAYTQFTSPPNITATTEATANSIVSAGAITFENVPHLIEFKAPWIQPGAVGGDGIIMVLYDGTSIGRLDLFEADSALRQVPYYTCHRLTPTAASHTYSVRAFVPSGTGTVGAGTGGSGNYMPGFIRITRVPT